MEQLFFTDLFVFSTASAVFPTRTALYSNDLELQILKSTILPGTWSLLNYHKFPNVPE